jgi:GNAT superfamily N-acetyltransferase
MTDSQVTSLPNLAFHPVTPDRWPDLEEFFGQGGHANCWCMWWRLKASEFDAQSGEERKQCLKAIVESGEVPGLLAYDGGRPIAWCSIGPRERFGRLERSPALKRVDDQPVWSIVCFLVAKPYRGKGLMGRFLNAVLDYARSRGAQIVEGYPIDATGGLAGYSGYTGIASTYRRAGFVDVLQRSGRKMIMRRSFE